MSSAASSDGTSGALQLSTVGAFSSSSMSQSTKGILDSAATSPALGASASSPSAPNTALPSLGTVSPPPLGALATLPAGSMYSAGNGGASSSRVAAEPFHFANLMTIKLGSDNYLLWRAAILPLLRSRFLTGYVDGSYPCPPERVLVQFEGRPAAIPNLEHRAWVMQDQAILSGINSSLTPSVGGLVTYAVTAEEAWTTLRDSFDTHSYAQSVHVRGQLQKMEKLNMSASAYFNKIKALSDSLTAIGQPLRQEDFIAYVLNGLDEDYDNLAENINGRETPISTRDLYQRLMATEQRLENRRSTAIHSGASANAAYRGGGRGAPRPNPGAGGGYSKPPYPTNGAGRGAPPPPSALPHSNNTGGGGGGGGGRRWNTSDGNRPLCQLCNALGHVSARCWKRFDKDFLGMGNDGANMERQVAMVTHGTNNNQAAGATSSYPVDPTWYVDTGATDHLIGELDKLGVKEPYHGKDHVHTANGAGSRYEGNHP